jgi:hypothetical protein
MHVSFFGLLINLDPEAAWDSLGAVMVPDLTGTHI